MRSSAGKIQLASLDELFGTAQAPSEPFQKIPLSDLHPFKGHPFHVVDDEKMQELAESVAQHGVLVPGIVRPRPEGGYELVSGHRRKRACELARLDTMPVFVRELDDDEAVLIIVDSNLQREKIFPSEKALRKAMRRLSKGGLFRKSSVKLWKLLTGRKCFIEKLLKTRNVMRRSIQCSKSF